MNKITDFYNKTNELIKINNELCSYHYSLDFKNSKDLEEQTSEFFDSVKNVTLLKRLHDEYNFYNHIFSGLVHRVNELKFMCNIDVNSRRIVFTNPDCISFIQILVRDKIYLSAHFRSSDFLGALPCDLKFIGNILEKFFEYFEDTDFNIDKSKEVNLTLNFGSLHIL